MCINVKVELYGSIASELERRAVILEKEIGVVCQSELAGQDSGRRITNSQGARHSHARALQLTGASLTSGSDQHIAAQRSATQESALYDKYLGWHRRSWTDPC